MQILKGTNNKIYSYFFKKNQNVPSHIYYRNIKQKITNVNKDVKKIIACKTKIKKKRYGNALLKKIRSFKIKFYTWQIALILKNHFFVQNINSAKPSKLTKGTCIFNLTSRENLESVQNHRRGVDAVIRRLPIGSTFLTITSARLYA